MITADCLRNMMSTLCHLLCRLKLDYK